MLVAVLRDGRTLAGGAVGVVEGSGASALSEGVASALGEQVAETSGIDEPSNFRRLHRELGQSVFLTRDE